MADNAAAIPAPVPEVKVTPAAAVQAATTFDQDTVNRLTATARSEGRGVAEKELLKDFGVTTAADLKKLVDEAKALKIEKMTDAQRTEQAVKDADTARIAAEDKAKTADSKLKATELKIAARDLMGPLGVSSARADQVMRLIDFDVDTFDPTKTEPLKKVVTEFLAKPENAHFKAEATGVPEGGARQRPAPGSAADKMAKLRAAVTRF